MKRLLDPTFRYVPAVNTSVAKTFARVRRALADSKKQQEAEAAERILKVRQLGRGPL